MEKSGYPCWSRLITLFVLLASTSFANCNKRTSLRKLDAVITNPDLYDWRVPPTNEYNRTEVEVGIGIRSIWNLNQQTMDCKMDLYLWLSWNESRLVNTFHTKVLLTESRIIRRIWKPEIYFPNSKYGKFRDIAVPNQLMQLFPNGSIYFSVRFNIQFSCEMDLRRFPFDKQNCSFEIAHIMRNPGKLSWFHGSNAITIDERVKLPQFYVDGAEALQCINKYSLDFNYLDCLKAVILFRRRLGFHLVHTYIPTIMIVVISWASFWMDVNAVPGRVALGITTLLTISSKSSALQSVTAEVSYVKAMDIWMMVCTALVFLALSEFVFANYIWRTQSSGRRKSTVCISKDIEAGKIMRRVFLKMKTTDIDKKARILFPLVFLIFNVIYWTYYLL